MFYFQLPAYPRTGSWLIVSVALACFINVLIGFAILTFCRSCFGETSHLSMTLSIHCSLCIYVIVFCAVPGLLFVLQHRPHYSACMQFLFVDFPQVHDRQLPSESWSPTTPLLMVNSSYCKVHPGLAPYSYYNMPGTQNKKCPA